MFKFINNLKSLKTKRYSLKQFADWINYSLWNRAIFVYTSATVSVVVRYCLYSLHNDSWLIDSVTVYSIFFSYTSATLCLFIFGVLKSMRFGDFIKKLIDIDRIRENKARNEKFRKLVAETHGAHGAFKVYSRSSLSILAYSFFLLAISSGTDFALCISIGVILYGLWALYNVFYFARCISLTSVPEDLKTIRPSWLIKLNEFSDSRVLVNGIGNTVSESTGLSGLGKRILNSATKAASKSFNYATDTKNTFEIFKGLVLVGSVIAGVDYAIADGGHRTTYVTRATEFYDRGTYSPDPDTRSKAAALRRRGFDLSDCCEPGTSCLNPELVENKYEMVRPFETKRYLDLEKKANALEEEVNALEEKTNALEEKTNALEEKTNALEEENRRLRLNLEGPCLG